MRLGYTACILKSLPGNMFLLGKQLEKVKDRLS